MTRTIGVGLIAALLAASAVGDTATLNPSQDNTIYLFETTNSNGVGDSFIAGITASNGTRRALVKFDVASAVPTGATVTSAQLVLTVIRTSTGTQPIRAHRALASWGEGTSNAGDAAGIGNPATPGDATWERRFFPDIAWAAPGGDFAPTASAAGNAGGAGSVFLIPSTPGMIADVQGWVDDPTANHGWILLGNETTIRTTKRIASREHPNAAFRPRLIINFDPPTALLGDMNCDGVVTVGDIAGFVLALTDPAGYAAAFPDCDINNADLNEDGFVTVSDIGAFVALLTG